LTQDYDYFELDEAYEKALKEQTPDPTYRFVEIPAETVFAPRKRTINKCYKQRCECYIWFDRSHDWYAVVEDNGIAYVARFSSEKDALDTIEKFQQDMCDIS